MALTLGMASESTMNTGVVPRTGRRLPNRGLADAADDRLPTQWAMISLGEAPGVTKRRCT